MPKAGDVVLYSAFGRTLNAIVLDARLGEVSHHGANGEPVLDLVFIDPARETAIEKKQIGYKPHVYTEYDVVHFSHEFSVEFKKLKGISTPAQIQTARGQGQWEEACVCTQDWADQCDQTNSNLICENEKLRAELARLYSSVAHPDPVVQTANGGTVVSIDAPDLGRGSALAPADPKDIPNSIDDALSGTVPALAGEDAAPGRGPITDTAGQLAKQGEGEDAALDTSVD